MTQATSNTAPGKEKQDEAVDRLLSFMSGEAAMRAGQVMQAMKTTGLCVTSTRIGSVAICLVNHEKAEQILERLSEVVDDYDDLAELEEGDAEDEGWQ